MVKHITAFLLLLSSPAYAGSALLDLSGYNNVLTFSQIGNGSIIFSANTPTNSNNTFVVQQIGGDHSLEVNLEGEFKDYELSIFQVSPLDLSLSVSQYCPTSCSPEPYSIYQY